LLYYIIVWRSVSVRPGK